MPSLLSLTASVNSVNSKYRTYDVTTSGPVSGTTGSRLLLIEIKKCGGVSANNVEVIRNMCSFWRAVCSIVDVHLRRLVGTVIGGDGPMIYRRRPRWSSSHGYNLTPTTTHGRCPLRNVVCIR